MTTLAAFLTFLSNVFRKVFDFLTSVYAAFITAIGTFVTCIKEVYGLFTGSNESVVQACNSVTSAANSFSGLSFFQSDVWQNLSYAGAISELWNYMLGAFGLFLSVVAVFLVVLMPMLVTAVQLLLAFGMLRLIVRYGSFGIVKV